MIKIENSNIEIPNLTDARAYIDDYGKVIVEMNEGYEMWDKKDYIVDGVYSEPLPEDTVYYTMLSLSPVRDFSLLVQKGVEPQNIDKMKIEAYDILMGVSE